MKTEPVSKTHLNVETGQEGRVDEVVQVLLIDDEPDICEALAMHLRLEGYHCTMAKGAEEAFRCMKTVSFHLVITDLRMPDVNGIEVLQRIRKDYPDIAVLVMTGINDRETAVQALEIGAYGYITKPFKTNELIINVVNALRRRRLELMTRENTRALEERIHDQSEEVQRSHEEIALRLIEAQSVRHDETGAHVRRIGLFSEAMGRAMGMERQEIDVLRLASAMHDVGKIGISDAILLKPRSLSDDEYEKMKQHTIIGARILSGSKLPLLETACQIAIAHHEHWDGAGYPYGISGEEIPQSARIVSILDVYDALVNERIYRKALPDAEALSIIKEGYNKQFDPAIYDVFMRIQPELREIREQVPEPPRGVNLR